MSHLYKYIAISAVILPTLANAAERVVQFAGVVSSVTERRETTEFLDKVLCNLVIVNTSQTTSNQTIVGVNFYNYGYSGTDLNSARVFAPATAPGAGEELRYNQIMIHPSGGAATETSCIGKTLEPLATCVMQFITNTIPAGSSTIGVCAGNVRVQDSNPASPGFVVASGSASLIQEVRILGGVLSGAHFLSGPAFNNLSANPIDSTAVQTAAPTSAANAAGTGPQSSLPANMNIECRSRCRAVAPGVMQAISKSQNPGSDGNGGAQHGIGSVFDTVRAFCRGNGSSGTSAPYYTGKSFYDQLWTNSPPTSSSDAGTVTTTAITFGGVNGMQNQCTAAELGSLYLQTLKDCHYKYFQEQCINITEEVEKSFYEGVIGYTEESIYVAFARKFQYLAVQMETERTFVSKCMAPLGLFNIDAAGLPSAIASKADLAANPPKIASYPASGTPPSAACNAALYSNRADQSMGVVGNYIVQKVIPGGLRGNTSPFRYRVLPGGPNSYIPNDPAPSGTSSTSDSLLCDAVCGGAGGISSVSYHEPNLGLEAVIADNIGSRTLENANRMTFGGLAHKIAPPELAGGLVKEMLIGGFGTICSANASFLDYNNIKDTNAFISQSINGQFRYCENRPQGGSDDLLFGVQGLVSFPVNGGSPF